MGFMKNYPFLLGFFSFLFFSFNIADALYIGIAPGVDDVGEVKLGEEYVVEFYLISNHKSDLVVDLGSTAAPYDFYSPSRQRSRYKFLPSESSEEDVSGWLSFMENPVIVPPEKNLYSLKNGGLTNANKRVLAILHVPENAEPGYHAGSVIPTPRSRAQGGGTGLGIISTVRFNYVFRVVGDVKRSGQIMALTYSRDSKDHASIGMLFKNNGTNTMFVYPEWIKLYDKDNESRVLAVLETGPKLTRPKEIVTFSSLWNVSGLENGIYRISANISWITGFDYYDGYIELEEYVPKPEITAAIPAVPAPFEFPLWIVPIIILILSLIIHWRKNEMDY